jgi:5,10-methylenetetrahydromethanopterin reductase
MTRIGVGLQQVYPPTELVALGQACEAAGLDTIWYGNDKFYRDPYIGLTILGLHTDRIGLGTFVADPYTIHPALTATMIASLEEVAPGRVILLLGAGGSGLPPLGIPRMKPVETVRDALQVIRALLRGEVVSRITPAFHLRNARLSFPPPLDRPIPIFIASRAPKMLRMAGALADGVMIASHATPEGFTAALKWVAEGAQTAGRRLADIHILSRIDVCFADDPAAAIDAARVGVVGLLAASYPDKSFLQPLGLEIPRALEEILAQHDRELAGRYAHLVPEAMVEAFTWAGTLDDVVTKARRIIHLGVQELALSVRRVTQEPLSDRLSRLATALRAGLQP